MFFRADDDIEIAGRSAMTSSVALAGNPYALAIAGAGFSAHFERLSAADDAFPVTHRAG